MKLVDYLNRIRQLDSLIRLRCTGAPRDLSEKLGVSEKTVYRCLADLKELGAPITYSRRDESYVYEEKDYTLTL